MTAAAIQKNSEQAAIPYAVAKQIRELLDAARKSYGAEEWDGDDAEQTVLDLVTEE